VSHSVLTALAGAPGPVRAPVLDGLDLLADDDSQLALTCCYELHYAGFAGVHDGWEWEPALLSVRRELERAFLARLVDEVGPPVPVPAAVVGPQLRDLATSDAGPSLSRYLLERGTREEMREFCVHRSAYQRKEADPHTWAIPRLRGRAKAAMVAIQHDEYGEGRAADMHAELFAATMAALDLDPRYGAYLDVLPASTLATGNLVSLLGLHRRWRAACAGHLALFEMTSVTPMGRYAAALGRLGLDETARRFYEAHVVADAVHERIAEHELVAGLLESEPAAAGELLFGARALVEVERRFTARLLGAWRRGDSSLLAPLAAARVAS
jgi:hypothetical protein